MIDRASCQQVFIITLLLALTAGLWPVAATTQTLSVDKVQVRLWNRFADALLVLHQRQIAGRQIRTTESVGGYATNLNFYREIRYFDARDERLLSEIQWESDKPDRVHAIAVYVYDDAGRLSHDYLARYLPEHRNAPVQTLINVHHRDDELWAFRQFDASNARIYEQCSGRFFGEPFMASIEEHEMPLNTGVMPPGVSEALYQSCFGSLPTSAEPLIESLLTLARPAAPGTPNDGGSDDREAAEHRIELLTGLIAITPDKPQWYVQRGELYFQLQEFDLAIDDFSKAIALDDDQDDARFGRGMALGRAGRIAEGIADLDVYIQRHPDSSRAHTKRGVRYIWLGDLERAERDLSRAVELDPANAEAHDDLGVIHAQQQRYDRAASHFQAAIDRDPSYQKAHHNLAMVQHLTGQNDAALVRIGQALQLAPQSRNSLLLKAAILDALGRKDEARAISEHAEFLPEGNWSERFSVQ